MLSSLCSLGTKVIPPVRTGSFALGSARYFNDYSPSKIAAARKEMIRLRRLDQYAITLDHLEQFGRNCDDKKFLLSAQFCYRELPIRLAYRIYDLENMPFGMSNMSTTKTVRDWYIYSLIDMLDFGRPKTYDDAVAFTEVLRNIYDRHSGTMEMMARSVFSVKEEIERSGKMDTELDPIKPALDSFYTSRIGIRILLEQHLSLEEQMRDPIPGYTGIINRNTNPYDVAQLAIDQAQQVCNRQYGQTVPVSIYSHKDRTFSYIPSMLRHILFELLKNSMRATIEQHEFDDELPPIKVVISDGDNNSDIIMKISDEGGGIARKNINRIWDYFYSTSKIQFLGKDGTDFGIDSPMCGLGYGLPLSRLYAQYFGGSLEIVSIEGYGTDAYLYLKKVGDQEEPIQKLLKPSL
ncbi:pyruvate dehydrogenase kinase [Blastocystis sp. ATCC 50177/Nand II]|uniref:Protein-serine/threonine kinase n=1 Tax=Blastocystis sp. subtype 1 (strain ATCC 50177 / NandII) TaxID=478820 RepID=A0A196SF28_BLAHN|nr:pyruvate dehydrogenase kinase [Blastocystis sp. ATCC 50177/Nand II]